MYLKIHKSEREFLVAVCDKEVIGKTFKESNLILEASEFFYKGELATSTQVIEALANATIANLIGKKAVNCAIEGGYCSAENVIKIQEVPHAQIVMM
ncbi:MAG: DUF424 domain-containing protein [Methanosarcinales archaeon]|nr:DUF424 family protein [Methanosarcinales archaeon]